MLLCFGFTGPGLFFFGFRLKTTSTERTRHKTHFTLSKKQATRPHSTGKLFSRKHAAGYGVMFIFFLFLLWSRSPVTVTVTITWVGFAVNRVEVGARVGVGVGVELTLGLTLTLSCQLSLRTVTLPTSHCSTRNSASVLFLDSAFASALCAWAAL